MKRFFKRFFVFGFIFLLLVYATLMLLPKLTPEVDDSDLAIATPSIPDAENGYTVLSNGLSALWQPEDIEDEIANMALGTNWNQQLATTVIASNRFVLDALDAALRAPAFQAPKLNLDPSAYKRVEWRAAARLACLQAEQSFREGRELEGYRCALDVVRLGGRLQESNGGIVDYLVGCLIRSLGLETIRRHLPDCALSAAQLSAIAAGVLQQEASTEALTNAFKVDYQYAIGSLAATWSGKPAGKSNNPLERIKLTPVYNHRRTQSLFANETRALIAATSLPHSKRRLPPPSPSPSRVGLMLSGNAVGKITFQISESANRRFLIFKSQDRVQIHATAALVAMRAYQIEHGRLPNQLTQLVPKYLPALPIDDFDGEALRFNPESKVLYSVGENGTDNHGVETDTRKHAPDYVFPIEF
jgi:hypothetical protein